MDENHDMVIQNTNDLQKVVSTEVKTALNVLTEKIPQIMNSLNDDRFTNLEDRIKMM